MSKVPDNNGQGYSKIPAPRSREAICFGKTPPNHGHLTYMKQNNLSEPDLTKDIRSFTKEPPIVENKKSTFNRTLQSFIPKMSLNLEKVVDENPRILDLRQKLNEITKKQQCNVDKNTKALINDITQQLDDKQDSESGPYSLLFELQAEASTSKEKSKNTKITENRGCDNAASGITYKCGNKMPNLINFDDKPMKEFEYSCENEVTVPMKRTFNVHSRSDLCLHFKPHFQSRFENISPNENSITRTNEENSLDDSLGILTPDQMDDICYLDNAFSPTVEGLPKFCDNESKNSPDTGDTPSTDKTESNSAASTMFLQNDEFGRKEEIITESSTKIPNVIIKSSSQTDVVKSNSGSFACFEADTQLHSRNQNIFHENTPSECIISVKEELVTSLLEDELLPSIHSSILEPISSVGEMNLNLDLPLDCKLSDNRTTQRIEQTPSPEDLPLDHSDINGEISTYSSSQLSTSTLHDSHTYSDIKNDFTKSIETSKVSNSFITSITSITSLDGYQGDGEMSRPVSRGADHSIEQREEIIEMDWQNVPVARRVDPMTDSDFFTESDADGLDDQMHRGDRKAQVIDGALYGGKNNNPPLIVNRNDDSCMDSSGVYTDLENHRSSPVFLNAIDDMSPEGSSPSTQSECSQKNGIGEQWGSAKEIIVSDSPINVGYGDSPKSLSKRNSLEDKSVTNDIIPKEEKKSFTLKKYKMPKRDVPSKVKTIMTRKADADSSVQNSPKNMKKSDRRENLSKKGANEFKIDYKTKSFKDIKSKVDCSFPMQRSQTACGVTRLLSSKSTNANLKPKSRHMRMRMELNSAHGSGKSSLHSSQSDISASSTPLGKHSTSRFPLLRNGKKRESGPPTAPSVPASPQQLPPNNVKKNNAASVPKLASSPVSVRARASLAPPPSPRKPAARRTPVPRPTTLPTNKEPPRVTAAVGPRTKRTGPQTPQGPPTRSSPAVVAPPSPPPVISPKADEQAAALEHAAKGVEALGALVQYLVFRLDALNCGTWKAEAVRWRGVAANEKGTAALSALESKQRSQKDFDTIAECSSRISELEMEVLEKEKENSQLLAKMEEGQHKYRSALHDISSLAADIMGLKETIGSLKREVSESRARLHAQGEIERTLRAQLEAAREELARDNCLSASVEEDLTLDDDSKQYNGHSEDLINGDAEEEIDYKVDTKAELSKDPDELTKEVQSLRVVLELKQAEAASLRGARTELLAERERRSNIEREARAARHAAEELRERAAARQKDADMLRDDNRRLREAAARDRDHAARLAALNEELRYKLRQNSQVLSLITGGSLRARTLSADSEAPEPRASPPPSPDASSPAVKGVVEKHDSVSWVLEIEDSPEEVASRLARRSSFRTASSPGGVKRRGGASPGGSPAPASPAPNASKLFRPGDIDFPPPPPPLKESAGEAIYIYDDRQY